MAHVRHTNIKQPEPGPRPRTPKTTRQRQRVCVDCPALCCLDLTIPTERPRTRDDIDDMTWELHYDRVHIAIRNRRWYIVIEARCRYLDDDNLCTVYDHRPEKCREHNPPDCERFGCWYDTLISTPEELEAYLKPKKRGARGRGKKR